MLKAVKAIKSVKSLFDRGWVDTKAIEKQKKIDDMLMSFFPHSFIPQENPQHRDQLQLYVHEMQKGFGFNTLAHRVDSGEPVYAMDNHGVKIPFDPFPRVNLYYLYRGSDALRIPIMRIVQETFREGYKIVPEFTVKCLNCKKKFMNDPMDSDDDMECDDCGNKGKVKYKVDIEKEKKKTPISEGVKTVNTDKGFIKPDWQERVELDALVGNTVSIGGSNKNKLIDFGKKIMQDIALFDDVFLLFDYEYEIKDGNAIMKNVININRSSPFMTYLVCDRTGRLGYNDENERVYVCPFPNHRKELRHAKEGEDAPICREHKVAMKPCGCMIGIIFGQGFNIIGHNTERTYYTTDEMMHDGQHFHQSDIYGYSPAYTVFEKIESLGYMTEFVRKYYNKMRPPRAMLFIPSSSPDQLLGAMEKASQFAQKDPSSIFPMAVEPSTKGGRNNVQYVNMSGNLQELQFLEMERHFRRIIASIYNIPSLMSGENENDGKNETPSQMIPHNRGIMVHQEKINAIFKRILVEKYNINDFKIVLKAVEQADEIRQMQLRTSWISYAQQAQGAGFDVRFNNEGEIVTSSKPTKDPMDMMGGGMGGAGAGGFGGKPQKGANQKELGTDATGQPNKKRASDVGGLGSGSSSSGENTSQSNRGG